MSQLEKMKELEKEYRQYLPKKSYAVLRVDGKGFSKYTKHMNKPFDLGFTCVMRETAKFLAENIDGAILAYTQSDEISVIFSDLAGENTEWWFGGQVQKIVSVGAAMATAKFNSIENRGGLAFFDARVHHLNELFDVEQYLDWRQTDALKNSVSMLASHHFSHKQLDGKSTYERIRMLNDIDVDWKQLASYFREGSVVRREVQSPEVVKFMKGGMEHVAVVERKKWVVRDAPRFNEMNNIFEELSV